MYDTKVNDWFDKNRSLVLNDIEKGYKKDRYSEEDILNFLKRFDYNENIYHIASSLFNKLTKEVTEECYLKKIPYDQFKNEMVQICVFCCFGEYGRELSVGDFYELIKWDEVRELLEG